MTPRSGPTTTTALLDSLKDPSNAPIWDEFDARYRPILHGFARKLGLSQEDAADVAQQAMTEFVRDYRAGLYHRGKGRLSSWLISIARNRAVDLQRAQGRRRGWRGESAFQHIATPDAGSGGGGGSGGVGGSGGGGGGNDGALLQDSATDNALWEAERKQAILALALTKLRESSRMNENTIRAFELVAIRGVPSEAAARECGMTVDEIYVAKNRVTKQLREIVAEVTKAYEDD